VEIGHGISVSKNNDSNQIVINKENVRDRQSFFLFIRSLLLKKQSP
jgi:hypothetical protein